MWWGQPSDEWAFVRRFGSRFHACFLRPSIDRCCHPGCDAEGEDEGEDEDEDEDEEEAEESSSEEEDSSDDDGSVELVSQAAELSDLVASGRGRG